MSTRQPVIPSTSGPGRGPSRSIITSLMAGAALIVLGVLEAIGFDVPHVDDAGEALVSGIGFLVAGFGLRRFP